MEENTITNIGKGTDTVDMTLVLPTSTIRRKGKINWSDQIIDELNPRTFNLRPTGTRYNIGTTSHIKPYKKLLGVGYWCAIDVNERATIDLKTGKVLNAGLKHKLDKLTLAAYYASKDVIRRNYFELSGAVFFGFFLNYILKYIALMRGTSLPW